MDDEEIYELVTVKRRNGGIISRGKFKGSEVLVKSQFRIHAGDYLISKRQVVHGANGIVPKELDGAIVSNEYLVLKGNEVFDINYLARLSEIPMMYKYFLLSSYGIDIEKLVFDVPDWKKRKISIPHIKEQKQIVHFFRTLDDTVTLHKRKLDGLKELKRGYLQRMFPQVGERVPRVRFEGFNGEWEERKLEEVAEFSKGNGYSKGDLTDRGTPIILYGRLYTKYETIIEDVDSFVKMKEGSVISCGGEVIVPSSGETAEDISRASVVEKQGVILGGDLNIVRADSTIHPAFLAITISNGNQQKELSKRAQGKSVVHISNSDLKNVVLHLPTLPEQTAIGGFFRSLDKQITTQVQKLEQLKQLKAAYLQRMFV